MSGTKGKSGVYTRTEYHKQRISKSLIGKNTWSKGRKLPEE